MEDALSIEPKRLRFSDLSSNSGSSRRSSLRSSRSRSSTPADLVARLTTSFTTISTASAVTAVGNRDVNDPTTVLLPINDPSANQAHPSRHSCATTASGTTVWTGHGSARTTIGANAGRVSSTENTENTADVAFKLRRMTVGTVSSTHDNSIDRSVTPTEMHLSPMISLSQRTIAIADDTEELPPTQPSGPLRDVTAYVEVYSGTDNRSAMIGSALRDLGATVSQRFTSKVTHVVFREGRQPTIERARSRNVFLVSVLWVDKCQRTNQRASELEFPIMRRETRTPQILGRERKLRAMQPRPLEVEMALTDECVRKRKQRLDTARLKNRIVKEIRSGAHYKSMPALITDDDNHERVAETKYHLGNLFDLDADADDDTHNSSRDQGSDIRNESDVGESPNDGGAILSQDVDTLADSVRRKLFETGGVLHGTPMPSFLGRTQRSKRRRTRANTGNSIHASAQSLRRLRDMNAMDGSHVNGTVATAASQRVSPVVSKIDQIVSAVCEKVNQMEIGCGRPATRRRKIFNPKEQKISSHDDLSESDDDLRSLTARIATNAAAVDVREIFGNDPVTVKERKRKTNRRTKKDGDMVRLRSSMFQVKSSVDVIQQLQMGRRSSDDFCQEKPRGQKTANKNGSTVPRKEVTAYPTAGAKRRPKSSARRLPPQTMVLTNVKEDDRELIYAIVKRLEGFRVEKKVTADTTHVICGENRRTLNLLMGVARGCFILPVEWIYHSLASGSWLSETQFELENEFPGAKSVRKQKHQLATSISSADMLATCRLFSVIGSFYVGPLSQPPPQELRTLIRWCGGKVALTSRRASYCIGCEATHDNAIGLKETWALDSIMAQELLPIDNYIIL